MYDYAVVIMRAQPFHLHHKALVDRALTVAPNVFIVLGSCSDKRTARNPFLPTERRRMIKDCYPGVKLQFIESKDYNCDVLWSRAISVELPEGCGILICNVKDGEPHYGEFFPKLVGFTTYETFHPNATEIRAAYFEDHQIYNKHLPPAVVNYLERFQDTEAFWDIMDLRLGEQIA
jgi:bifunctional NMN adenylyltransferase/nudix hydrolase